MHICKVKAFHLFIKITKQSMVSQCILNLGNVFDLMKAELIRPIRLLLSGSDSHFLSL